MSFEITTLLRIAVELVGASPLARNSVPKGGSSALLAAISSLPSVVNAISSTRVVPPVEMLCLIGLFDDDGLRSMTLSVLSPSPA